MSIERIIEKILSDASAEAAITLDKAENEKNINIEKAKRKAEKILKEAKEKAEKDGDLIKERKLSVTELDARKLVLEAKQKAISKCFDRSLDLLTEMDKEDYKKLLVSVLVNTGVKGGELLLNETDKKNIGETLAKLANEEIMKKHSDKLGEHDGGLIVLSDELIKSRGGFVLRKGLTEYNSTIEVMVRDIAEESTPEVASILFQNKPD